jgi:hypothetical protein
MSSVRRGIVGLVAGCGLLLGGCTSAPKPATPEPLTARFYLESKPGEAGVTVQLPQSGITVQVGAKPVVTEYDIVNAEVVQVDLGRCLMVQLTPAASRDLYRLSVGAVGRRLVLSLDQRFVGARRIDGAMATGEIMVFVETPDVQLPGLVERLRVTSTALASAAKTAKTN